MAEDSEGRPNADSRPGAVRRAATDPGMEERASQDREAASPRVRFSQDLDRATASAFAATRQRPGAPDLSIDTRIGGLKSNEGLRPAASTLSKKASSSASPTSPRTRDRGYSLRRSLFARTINNQPEVNSVELAEAGSSSAAQDDPHRQGEGKSKRTSSVTVSPVFQNDLVVSNNSLNDSLFEGPIIGKDKMTFGTINLPNYDVWARQTAKPHAWLQRLKVLRKQATKIILRQTEIPPSKDGRHISLDAARTSILIDERTGHPYIGNAIRSSRYTLWNFVPRQLFFQFSKLANAYFLLVSILQMIPGLSTTGSYTTIAPLLVFVAISMGKVSSVPQNDTITQAFSLCSLTVLHVRAFKS